MKVSKNPVFIICLILFFLHQVSQKLLHYSIPVIDAYLDPLVCMPIFLGFLLIEHRWVFHKNKIYYFQPIEIVVYVVFLALIFELVFPWLSPEFTSDWRDVLLYLIGGFIFAVFINSDRFHR